MKYIPGSAKISISQASENTKKNVFEVYLQCDANDGDYLKETWTQDSFSEFDILMISYLKLNRHTVPKQWVDSRKEFEKNCNYPFGGTYLEDNYRFNNKSETYNWLYNWASDYGYLLPAGMCDSMCHSIDSIEVTYYNELGDPCKCEFPDLGELFDSEKEFIDYIRSIYKEEDD